MFFGVFQNFIGFANPEWASLPLCLSAGNFWRFNEERYKCALGVGWSVSVELVIGPQCGISHVTEKGVAPTKMADFLQVMRRMEEKKKTRSGG